MLLQLDAGNTRIKWRLYNQTKVAAAGSDLRQALQEKPEWLASVQEVWVSSVHTEQDTWIKSIFSIALFAQSQVSCAGLSNSYEDVHKMGVDRWLAMLAVWQRQPNQSHIVIDAGTAITLDIIDEFGRHVGGYICPGFNLMKSSLLSGTKKVWAEDEWQLGRAPGNRTQLCVDHGIQDMVACWLEHHRALQPAAQITLTGGDGPRLGSLLAEKVSHQTDLVLDGLAVYFQHTKADK